jgi:hypothetical protein
MAGVKEEFSKRVREMKPMVLWVEALADRRIKRRDEGGAQAMPEKEFLLTKAQQIQTNPRLEENSGDDNGLWQAGYSQQLDILKRVFKPYQWVLWDQ